MAKKPVHVRCSRCSGQGRLENIIKQDCAVCVGRGWIRGFWGRERTCRKCAGEGSRVLNIGDSCHLCDGRGYIVEMHERNVGPLADAVAFEQLPASSSPFPGASAPERTVELSQARG